VEALVLRAAQLGQPALALTDTNSVTGVVSLAKRCAKAGVKPIGGCEIILEGGHRLTLLMDGPQGWRSLCRILTRAGLRDAKREGLRVRWEDVEENITGLVCLSGRADNTGSGEVGRYLRFGRYREAEQAARRHLAAFGSGGYFIEVSRTCLPRDRHLSERLLALADHLGVPAVATNAVHHATKAEAAAHETLCRVRLGIGPDEEHAHLPFNGERYLKGAGEMGEMFADRRDALANAAAMAERLAPPLDTDARHLPAFPHLPPGESEFSYLSALTWCGAEQRYKDRFTPEVKARLVHELETIHSLGFCGYFLVCWDVCRESRKRRVRYALRGSAVGSAVAYCLWISHHDPIARNISFERFMSKARAKPPDVDIDFAHDARDGMMGYVRQTYGDDRVANVSNYVTYRGRSLLRDFGKALGFDTSEIDRLRELLHHSRGDDLAEHLQSQPELRALGIEAEQYADLFALCAQAAGLPRHLGTHSSGIVISDAPLEEVAPLVWAAKGVTVCALDKDDVEAPGVGLLKMDQLCLRALTAVDISVQTVGGREPGFDYDGRDREDGDTLAMIRAAETVGVFQLESPAQMALQWRLQADRFDDLIASVALIRPGPMVGGSVTPYVHRRKGWEPVTYPLPELEPVLRETYGRILYQDQVLDVVKVVGGFTEGEERLADAWLKAMTHARSEEEMTRLGIELRDRAKERHGGRLQGKAFSKLWKQIKGFSRYGFAHGHALAFADHAQGTGYMLRHYPADFLAAVLSVEPCGFWPVATVAAEAERRGVRALGPCVNRSQARQWTVERTTGVEAIRCSLSFVQSVTPDAASAIVAERETNGPFTSLEDFCRRCSFLGRDQMEWLVVAGAVDMLEQNRRRALWSLPVLHRGDDKGRRGQRRRNIGQAAFMMPIPPLLPSDMGDFSGQERFWKEWNALGFSPQGHPMCFWRDELSRHGVLACASLQQASSGQRVTVAGLLLRPHRPPMPSGETFVFLSLEDETGMAQVTVTPDVYQQQGAAIFGHAAARVTGIAERRGAGNILRAEGMESLFPA
jgi:error-prone DNA polymerase